MNTKQIQALAVLKTKAPKASIKLTDVVNGEYTYCIQTGNFTIWATIKTDGSVIL